MAESDGSLEGQQEVPQREIKAEAAGTHQQAASLDFPGVRFADDNIITKPKQETQVVVESLRENRVEDVRPEEHVEELVEVDWLGLPLAPSTLPDYTSIYRHHFPHPASQKTVAVSHRLDAAAAAATDTGGRRERPLHQQFPGVGWVKRDTVPPGQEGGYVKMGGEVGRALVHPQGHRWNTPHPVVRRLRRTHPAEYFNLCDPLNQIPLERLVYNWSLRDAGTCDERVVVGRAARASGFTNNSCPHLPPPEDRNFTTVYSRSYNVAAASSDVEGLCAPMLGCALQYPGYCGASTMNDTPSSVLKLTPHLLRTRPDLLQRPRSHALRQAHRDFTNS